MNKTNIFRRIIKVLTFLIIVGFLLSIAPNYEKDKFGNKTNLIINNNNVTKSLKKDVYIDNKNEVYLSKQDIENFFDPEIYYDEKYNQIITTSNDKVGTLGVGSNEIFINNSKKKVSAAVIKQEETYYIPISEIEEVYNIELEYKKEKDIVTIDSLNKEQKKANSDKKTSVKYLPTIFSKTVDKINEGEDVIIIDQKNEWFKIRSQRGKVGYIKNVNNIRNARDNMDAQKQIEGKVSIAWDYFSEYVKAPTRTEKIEGINVVSPSFAVLSKNGKGELQTNIGTQGEAYINWANKQGYKVWPMISNNSMIDKTSEILNDYQLRQNLINNIVKLSVLYDFDGINIDFENMYEKDKEMFSRFVIELAPRLKEYGKALSVDVTAPDGGETWSMCFDRNKISKYADYIVFMAYDQNGSSSPKEGTTAGANWVEANIKKFLGQEGVEKDKIILGIPLYTRLWKEQNGDVTSSVVSMKEIYNQIPADAKIKWDNDLKQNYAEYSKDRATYKIWIEDEKSIKAKIDLMKEYELGGVAFWTLDRGTSTIWQKIQSNIK